jgi:methoxymalonate biosynthesis acyl carrier protein
MADDRQQRLQALIDFLRTIQKPGKAIESVGLDESLVISGLIDSLAIIEIVMFLEKNYGIDFAASGLDPDRLATINGILGVIEEARP